MYEVQGTLTCPPTPPHPTIAIFKNVRFTGTVFGPQTYIYIFIYLQGCFLYTYMYMFVYYTYTVYTYIYIIIYTYRYVLENEWQELLTCAVWAIAENRALCAIYSSADTSGKAKMLSFILFEARTFCGAPFLVGTSLFLGRPGKSSGINISQKS